MVVLSEHSFRLVARLVILAAVICTQSARALRFKRMQRSIPIGIFSLQPPSVKSLIIDNYDSYTYNIFQAIGARTAHPPVVIRNDQFSSWSEAIRNLDSFDNVIISPGPGNPNNKGDFGLCHEALTSCKLPILGVCLGHQGIGSAFGGKVIGAEVPMHGRISKIKHTDSDVFHGVPQGSEVVRYHSLVVDPSSFPEKELEVTAWVANDNGQKGEVMGLRHRRKPIFGVQFHPESIRTSCGDTIFDNFVKLTMEFLRQNPPKPAIFNFLREKSKPKEGGESYPLRVWSVCDTLSVGPDSGDIDIRNVFELMFGNSSLAFLLDSSVNQPVKTFLPPSQFDVAHSQRQQVSYFGALDWTSSHDLEFVDMPSSNFLLRYNRTHGALTLDFIGRLHSSSANRSMITTTKTFNQSIFSFIENYIAKGNNQHVSDHSPDRTLDQGLFGYLGYEIGEELYPTIRNIPFESTSGEEGRPPPDACFLQPESFIQYDHQRRLFSIKSSFDPSFCDSSSGWTVNENRMKAKLKSNVDSLKKRIQNVIHQLQGNTSLITSLGATVSPLSRNSEAPNRRIVSPQLLAEKTKAQYRHDIETCLEQIKQGETYEVCLTTQFHGKLKPHPPAEHFAPFEMYKQLQDRNPAPHSAYLRLQPLPSSGLPIQEPIPDLAICCSSPEQYLRINQAGHMVSKPIKGTAPRERSSLDDGQWDDNRRRALYEDEKTQAENLMIVDLVRNDFGRVCDIGSVRVPRLMDIESYAKVHQMVSTITGQLSDFDKHRGLAVANALRATFPGGSMTGAPKLRTMEWIRRLEKRPRGVYSGALGYIGKNGDVDLNIVIRTALLRKVEQPRNEHEPTFEVTIGAGGAIVAMSTVDEEMSEVLVKAGSVAASWDSSVAFPSDP